MLQRNIPQNEAVELLLKTAVYEMLLDKETMLYTEPRECVLDMLNDELNGEYEKLMIL
jgi:hypothetical protein